MVNLIKKLQIILLLGILLISNIQAKSSLYSEWYQVKTEFNGKVKKVIETTSKENREYIFDENSKIIEKLFINGDNSYAFSYSYDSKGNLDKITYKVNDKVVSEQFATYQANNTIEAFKIVDYDGDEISEHSSTMVLLDEYDNFKHLIFRLDENESVDIKFDYDEKGNLIRLSYYSGDKILTMGRFKYNAEGFVEKSIRFNDTLNVSGRISNSYLYDEQGNWIERKSSYISKDSKGKDIINNEITTREIFYYNDKKNDDGKNWFQRLFN